MLHLAKKMPVKRISPDGGHFFFGYYDIQPYNFNETLHLAHRVSFIDRLQTKNDSADVGFIEVGTGRYEKLDTTFAWNFQQGAMLQWNPVSPDREVVYNSYDKNGYCGVIMDIHNGKKRFLERPVANVSNDGRYALGINMQRLYDFRPGYGYAGEDLFYESNHPENDGVYVIDMQTGKAKLILSLDDIWSFSGGFFEKDEKIIVNHLTFNTSGTRFLLLVRNFPQPGEKHKTAIRCDLHPRWNRSGDSITFDSTHEGFRGIYSMGLPE